MTATTTTSTLTRGEAAALRTMAAFGGLVLRIHVHRGRKDDRSVHAGVMERLVERGLARRCKVTQGFVVGAVGLKPAPSKRKLSASVWAGQVRRHEAWVEAIVEAGGYEVTAAGWAAYRAAGLDRS